MLESQGLSSPTFVECLSAPATVVTTTFQSVAGVQSINQKTRKCLIITSVLQCYLLLVLSLFSPYFPVCCVIRCQIVLLHHSFYFPSPPLFGPSSSFPSFRRPGQYSLSRCPLLTLLQTFNKYLNVLVYLTAFNNHCPKPLVRQVKEIAPR